MTSTVPRAGDEGLDGAALDASPYALATAWYGDAEAHLDSIGSPIRPLVITLATVAADGMPSQRPVLMQVWGPAGPGFFSHLGSRKGVDLSADPRISASLVWPELFRSIHFRGVAQRREQALVEAQWRGQPRDAKLAGWASDQSQPIADQAALRASFADSQQRFTGVPDDDIPAPEHFAGWRIVADEVEFWAGRRDRLHDRIRYVRQAPGSLDDDVWSWERVQP